MKLYLTHSAFLKLVTGQTQTRKEFAKRLEDHLVKGDKLYIGVDSLQKLCADTKKNPNVLLKFCEDAFEEILPLSDAIVKKSYLLDSVSKHSEKLELATCLEFGMEGIFAKKNEFRNSLHIKKLEID